MKKGISIILTVLMVISLMAKPNHEIYAKSNLGSSGNEAIKMYDLEEQDSVIEEISGAVVISSNQVISNQTINGDLYIAPNVALSSYNLTVNGNVYVLGGLLGGNISVYGTVYCNSSTVGYTTTLYPGMFAWYGSCSIHGLTCSNRIVNQIPLRFDQDLIVDANGNLLLKGATLNIADMVVNGKNIELDSRGCFNQKINIGEADQITITRYIDGWYSLKQTIEVQHERPESLKIDNLPNQTVYQDGDKLNLEGLKIKAVYKDGTEKDVTDYIEISDIEGIGTNKIKVTYRGCETTFDVQVKEIKAESILLDKSDITLEIGKTEQLRTTILPDNTSNKKVAYRSSDDSIVSVDDTGKIEALKEGNAIITAKTANNLEANCKVQVIKHTHQWNEGKVINEASCTENGQREYTCKTCGKTKIEEIEAKGHDWSNEYTVDEKPTCIKNGIESIHCKTCGESKKGTEKEILAKGHQWDEGKVTKEASCINKGERTYICETCDETKTEEIEAKGHDWSNEYTVDKKATCTEKGVESIHCKTCGESKKGTEKEILAIDHQWKEGSIVKEANCTDDGQKEYICERCGEKRIEKIGAKGHVLDKIMNVKKPTYTSEGYTGDIYCKICGEKISAGQKIEKLTVEIPQKIVIKKLTAGKKKIKVRFKSTNNAVKYQIQYSLKKSMKSSKVKAVTKTTNTIKKLKSKKRYYVRVRAINIQGKAGSWSKISKIKVK